MVNKLSKRRNKLSKRRNKVSKRRNKLSKRRNKVSKRRNKLSKRRNKVSKRRNKVSKRRKMGGSWIHTVNYGPLHQDLAIRFNTVKKRKLTMDSDQKNIIANFFGNLINGGRLRNRSRYMFNSDSFKLMGIGGDKIVLSGLRKGKTYIIFIIMGILENLFDSYKIIHSKGKYCNKNMNYNTHTSKLHFLKIKNFYNNFYDEISTSIVNIGRSFIEMMDDVEKNENLNCLVYYEDKYNTVGILEIVKLISDIDLYKLIYKVIIEIEKLHRIGLLHLDINCSNLLVRVPDTFTKEFSTSISTSISTSMNEIEVVLIDFDTVEAKRSAVGHPTIMNRLSGERLNPYNVGEIELNPHKYPTNTRGDGNMILTQVIDYAAFALVGIEILSDKYGFDYVDFYHNYKNMPELILPVDKFMEQYTYTIVDNKIKIINGNSVDNYILYKLICLLVGELDVMVIPKNHDESKWKALVDEIKRKDTIFKELKDLLEKNNNSPPVSPTTPK